MQTSKQKKYLPIFCVAEGGCFDTLLRNFLRTLCTPSIHPHWLFTKLSPPFSILKIFCGNETKNTLRRCAKVKPGQRRNAVWKPGSFPSPPKKEKKKIAKQGTKVPHINTTFFFFFFFFDRFLRKILKRKYENSFWVIFGNNCSNIFFF